MIFTKTHLIPFVNRLIQDDPNDHYVRVIFNQASDYRSLTAELRPLLMVLARGLMDLTLSSDMPREDNTRIGLPHNEKESVKGRYLQLLCLASVMATGRVTKLKGEGHLNELADQMVNMIQEIHVHSRHMDLVPGADVVRLVLRDPISLPKGLLDQDSITFTLDLYVDLTDAIKSTGLNEMYRQSQPGGEKKKVSLTDAVPEVLSGGSAAMRAAATQLSMDGGGADDMTGVAYPLEQDTGESLPGFEPEHVAHTQQPVVSEVPIESVSDVPSLNAKPVEESISPEGLAPITRY